MIRGGRDGARGAAMRLNVAGGTAPGELLHGVLPQVVIQVRHGLEDGGGLELPVEGDLRGGRRGERWPGRPITMTLPPAAGLPPALTSHSHSVRMLRCRSVTLRCSLRIVAGLGRVPASASRNDSSSYCRRHCEPASPAATAAQAGQRLKQAARQAWGPRAERPEHEVSAAARSRAPSRPRTLTSSSWGRWSSRAGPGIVPQSKSFKQKEAANGRRRGS